MGWTHKAGVGGTFANWPTGPAVSVTASGAFAVGDLIVVGISAGSALGSLSVNSVSDQLGNVYNSASNAFKFYDANGGAGANSGALVVYFAVCTTPGTPSVTITLNRAADYGCAMFVDGFTGVTATVDASATPASGIASATPGSGTTGATTNANQLALAIYADQGSSTTTGAASGYTAGARVSGSTANDIDLMYKDSGSTGSTLSAGNPISGGGSPGSSWAYLLVTLKLSAVQAAEAGMAIDSASVSVGASTTPHVSDAAQGIDSASVTIAGDVGLRPAGYVAPSWASYRPYPGRYTFYFADLQTNTLSMILPLTEVRFASYLNRAGTFSAKLQLADRRLVPDPVAAIAATTPEQAIVYVDRDGQLVAHASILTRSYDIATDTLSLDGQDLFWWFGKRLLGNNLSYNEDMMQVFRDLVTFTQGQPAGNLGIAIDNSVLSGVTINRVYQGDQQSNLGTILTELANLTPGFEFKVRAVWVGGVPQRQLLMAYPHFGIPAQTTGLLWAYPAGAITAMTWPEDGTVTARKVTALGNPQPDGTRPIAVSPASGSPGYPLTEETISFSIDLAADLQVAANAEEALRNGPITLPEVTVYGPIEPVFGTYAEGDHARYRIRAGTSGRWWAGMDTVWRIIGQEVTLLPDGTEQVKHLLSAALSS